MQLDHYSSRFIKKTFPITLVCDNVSNAPNIGSLFRIADAFGIEELIFCGKAIQLGRKALKTSRATEHTVKYRLNEDISSVVKELKTNQYQIIALEITKDSIPIHKFKLKQQRIALVVGDENFGVSESILSIGDAIVHIDMFGQNSSMNVVQATNIALYEITKQFV